MATVAGLEVTLGVNTKEFTTKLNRSKRTIRSFKKATVRNFKAIAAAATAATAAFAAVAKQGINAADDIAKSAKNAGLSAEAYQRLSESFRLGGSSAAALTKGNQSLQRSVLNLSRGLKTQQAAFGKLGLTYRQLQDLSPEQQFLLVRDRLSEVTDLTTRNALAQELMGRAGKELGSIMELTSDQIRAQGQRLQDLGGIIRGDLLPNAEALNDSLSTTVTVIQAQFVNALLGAVQQTQTASGEVASLDGAIKKIGEVVSSATTAFLDFLRTLYDWRVEIGYGIAAFVALKIAVFSAATVSSIAAVTGAIITFTKSIAAMTVAFTVANRRMIGMIAVGAAIVAAFAAIGFAAYTARDALTNSFSQAFKFLSAKFQGFILSTANMWLHFRLLAMGAFDALKRTVVASLNAIIKKYNDLVDGLPLPKFNPLSEFNSKEAQEARRKVREAIDANTASLALTERAAYDAAAAIAEIEFPSVGEIVDEAKLVISTVFEKLKALVADSVSSVIPSFESGSSSSENNTTVTADDVAVTASLPTFWEKVLWGFEIGADEFAPKFGERLNESLSQTMSQAIVKGDFKKFGSLVLTSIETSLQDHVANKLKGLFEAFFEGFFSAIEGALSSSAGGGDFMSSLGGFVGGLFAGTAHDGGMVPGGPREEVPILALGGEAVLTREQQKNLFGGGARGQTITQTFNVTGDVTSATRRSMREMADELATQTQVIFNERGLLRT